jgi:hypothetical protein
MFNPGDAVARLDSFVITVTGAAPLVGERKLVRIESIKRSAAVAELVDGPPPPGAADDGGEDGLESDARGRRGRRGGRRRSRAGSGSAPGNDA